MLSILTITKGYNSNNIYMKLQFLFSAHRLMMLYICTKFRENILNDLRVMERKRFVTVRQTTEKNNISPPEAGYTVISQAD